MKVLIVAEGRHELEGALEVLVRRIFGCNLECKVDKVSRSDIHAHHGKGPGYFKRAVRWMKEAQKDGFYALVMLIDHDGYDERVHQVDEAQETDIVSIKRALGVAIIAFDAWILADEIALTSVLEIDVNRQPDPENSRDPKQVCAQLLARSPHEINQSEMYTRVTRLTGTDVLKGRCPRGFEPFATRIEAI